MSKQAQPFSLFQGELSERLAQALFPRRVPILFVFAAIVWPVILATVGLGAAPEPGGQVRPQAETVPDSADFEPWNGGRYRLMPSDVFELTFPYVAEFNQVLTVQPDGYVNLRAVGDVSVQGRTLPEIRKLLFDAYEPILRDPVITIVLKEFEKPFFIAAGQVKQPGKFDLRGRVTVTQSLAVAGGLTDAAKPSQVILFRRFSAELLEVKEINVKKMLASHDLSEDPVLRPGDTVFVPKSRMAALKPFIPVPGIGMYLNPLAW
jgi:polysaccharide export outer membrane protein